MKQLLTVLLFALGLNLTAHAQNQPEKLSKEELAVWQTFVENAGMGTQLEGMRNLIIPSIRQNYPDMPPKLIEEMSNELHRSIQDFTVNYVIPCYRKHFTLNEIKQINAFYQTPVGKKMKEKTPVISQELLTDMQEWQNKLRPKIADIISRYQAEKNQKPKVN